MKNFFFRYLLGCLLLINTMMIGACQSATQQQQQQAKTNVSTSQKATKNDKKGAAASDNEVTPSSNSNTNIPEKVWKVLDYVTKNGKPMPNYVGGRTFQNREKRLPMSDQYQEWDVNPKVKGQNRGAERLVTAQSGKAYYTNDHYRTFQQIK